MISRRIQPAIEKSLSLQPAVAILGPRQVGKTTLARAIADSRPSIYLDLESGADRAKLQDAAGFLRANSDKLVVLDEIQRAPALWPELRGIIDDYRRRGMRTGKFLILGSASIELLRQSGETLAGRVAYIEMTPVDAMEIPGGVWLATLRVKAMMDCQSRGLPFMLGLTSSNKMTRWVRPRVTAVTLAWRPRAWTVKFTAARPGTKRSF